MNKNVSSKNTLKDIYYKYIFFYILMNEVVLYQLQFFQVEPYNFYRTCYFLKTFKLFLSKNF